MSHTAVWWWLRSPYYNNNNNFCNVNNNGNNNNNNANYSGGLRPGFCNARSNGSSFGERRPLQKEKYFPGESLKLPFDDHARTLLAWRGIAFTSFHVYGQRSIRHAPTRHLCGGRIKL